MTRLLACASMIAVACSLAPAALAAEQGAPVSGTPSIEDSLAFHANLPAWRPGEPFAGAVFGDSTVLPVTPVNLMLSPELYAPALTGSADAPAAPVMWAGDSDYGLSVRFIASVNQLAGPQDDLRPSNLGILAALSGTGPTPMTAKWMPVHQQIDRQLTDYAFEFGAEDLTDTVTGHGRTLAMFGWNGEIDAPVLAQGE